MPFADGQAYLFKIPNQIKKNLFKKAKEIGNEDVDIGEVFATLNNGKIGNMQFAMKLPKDDSDDEQQNFEVQGNEFYYEGQVKEDDPNMYIIKTKV